MYKKTISAKMHLCKLEEVQEEIETVFELLFCPPPAQCRKSISLSLTHPKWLMLHVQGHELPVKGDKRKDLESGLYFLSSPGNGEKRRIQTGPPSTEALKIPRSDGIPPHEHTSFN